VDSGLPADVLGGKLKKDISFALRRGTIAQVTNMPSTVTPARARSSAEDQEELLLALNRRAGGFGSLEASSSFSHLPRCVDPFLKLFLSLDALTDDSTLTALSARDPSPAAST
jgi:hypothetical protein